MSDRDGIFDMANQRVNSWGKSKQECMRKDVRRNDRSKVAWYDRIRPGLWDVKTVFLQGQEYRVRVYDTRLAIHAVPDRVMSWEEIQAVKEEVWGDCMAVEVYPPKNEVVNFRHTRHLWSAPGVESMIRHHCIHPEFIK